MNIKTCALLTFLLQLFLTIFIRSASAQEIPLRCAADYSHLTDKDPAQIERIKKELIKIRENVLKLNAGKTHVDSLLVVPVVVHVLHDNGKGAISKAQIEDGLSVLNTDLRKFNADTINTRELFRPFAAPLNFEFRLAKIDPYGNCTEGIVYINTAYTYNVLDTSKSVSWWPTNKYFNFWTVCTIDPSPWNLTGTIIGYEQFPWKYGINNTYGAVVRHDSWGRFGTAPTTNDSRTITHEVGHCFGLWHMWQDQSVGGVGDGCAFIVGSDCTNNDDMVCDTPPMQKPFYGCTTNLNSCTNDTIGPSPYANDTVDQTENFMSYHDCQNMFSQGQKQRVDAVFTTYPELQNLISPANLVATGTNDGYVAPLCAPEAWFTADKNFICAGTNVIYTDKSYKGAPASWQWYFPGGTPSSSAAVNPNVKYSTAGTYDVTLVVTNASGSDSVTYQKFIVVSPTTAKYNTPVSMVTESFEDSAIFSTDWHLPPVNGKGRWQRTQAAAYTGSSCIMTNNYLDTWLGELVEIVTPSYNLSTLKTPEFSFKVAYCKYDDKSNDILRVLASTDCGRVWTPRFSRTATALATDSNKTTAFVPASALQWKEDKFTVTGTFATSTNVMFKIQLTAGNGNNIYLDDINVKDIAVGINEQEEMEQLTIHPNPASGEVPVIEFVINSDWQNVSLTVFDIFGREINKIIENRSLNSGTYSYKFMEGGTPAPGVYFVRLSSSGFNRTERVIVY